MAYQIEEWDYASDDDIEKVVSYFRENRRLVVLIDREKDKSFIIVGNCQNKTNDMKQAELLLAVANSPEFPYD